MQCVPKPKTRQTTTEAKIGLQGDVHRVRATARPLVSAGEVIESQGTDKL